MSDSIVVKTPVGRVLYDNISTTDKYYDGFTLTMTFDPADEGVVQMKQMIEQFIENSKESEGTFEVIEAVPYEAGQMVRSTAGSKRKSD